MARSTSAIGVREKLDRAAHHLNTFGVALADFEPLNRDIISRETDAQTGVRHYRVARQPTVPASLALIAGDVIHNLRSALDHLAFALCMADGQQLTPGQQKGIYFPITETRDKHEAAIKSQLQGLAPSDAIDEIRLIEPHGDGASAVLWTLAKLSNTDKHRLVLDVRLKPPGLDVGLQMGHMMRELLLAKGMEPIPIDSLSLIAYGSETELRVGDIVYSEPGDRESLPIRLAFPVVLNEPDITDVRPIVPLLGEMISAVDVCLRRLTPWI
jgi:hypothetical protein